MSFFDDGDEPSTATRAQRPTPRRTPPRAARGAADDRTLFVRRGAAALVIVLIVVLVVLGVKALLDSQATQALKDYVGKDVGPLVAQEQSSVRIPFFQQLDNAYNSPNQSEIPTNIQQYVQQEQTYYRQAQAWSVPSQMVPAQRAYVQVLGLRYEALQKIDNALPDALGTGNQSSAIRLIAGDMEMLLSSDVLYAQRVKPLIEDALSQAGITGVPVPSSAFLPDVLWVVPQTTAQRILAYVPSQLGGTPLNGAAGHQLVGVTASAGGHNYGPLSTTAVNTYTLGSQGITFNLQVQNTGTIPVHDVITRVTFSAASVHGVSCLDRRSSIPLTTPTGGIYTSPVVVAPASSCHSFVNQPLTMTARVMPLPGETDKTNNVQHYTVLFH